MRLLYHKLFNKLLPPSFRLQRRRSDVGIEKVLGRLDFVSTVTLWLECGRLMAEKQLELPENSIIVYSDEGANQMFYQDLEQSGAYTKKGIYYHAAFIAAGPRLVRGNNPVRMTEQVYHALGM